MKKEQGADAYKVFSQGLEASRQLYRDMLERASDLEGLKSSDGNELLDGAAEQLKSVSAELEAAEASAAEMSYCKTRAGIGKTKVADLKA